MIFPLSYSFLFLPMILPLADSSKNHSADLKDLGKDLCPVLLIMVFLLRNTT